MAIDMVITMTKDALPSVVVNPSSLSAGDEENMFLNFTWFGNNDRGLPYAPLDGDGNRMSRTDQNQAIAVRAWIRDMLRKEYKRMVDWEKERQANTARAAVTDFSGKADL